MPSPIPTATSWRSAWPRAMRTLEPAGLAARLQHVTLRTTDMAPMIAFYADALGFFYADRVEDEDGDPRACFFTLDREHHSLAFFKADSCRIDHHSYELNGWDQIRDWADYFAAEKIQLRWGPGRHGPGNNLFIFIDDPEGNWIEFSAELEVMDEDRELEIWPHEPKRSICGAMRSCAADAIGRELGMTGL